MYGQTNAYYIVAYHIVYRALYSEELTAFIEHIEHISLP